AKAVHGAGDLGLVGAGDRVGRGRTRACEREQDRERETHHAHQSSVSTAAGFFSNRLRTLWSRIDLRRRIDCGVTSTSSSSLMNSSAYSSVILRGGAITSFSSAAVVRMLVSFFTLHGLTTRSLSREWMPITMPG